MLPGRELKLHLRPGGVLKTGIRGKPGLKRICLGDAVDYYGARARRDQFDRSETRQDERTDRTDTRQGERTDRVDDRSDVRQDIAGDYNNHWHHYHDNYWHHNDAAWAFFGGLVLGAYIASLPPRYETVYVYSAPYPYYYANGAYYVDAASGGYEVAPAPVGATVENPPSQVVNVTVNEQNYGYANGAYYDVTPPEEEGGEPTYEVIAPPMGALVPSLPEGSTSTTVDDNAYFIYNDTHYRPFYSGSDVVYQVVEDPTAAAEG